MTDISVWGLRSIYDATNPNAGLSDVGEDFYQESLNLIKELKDDAENEKEHKGLDKYSEGMQGLLDEAIGKRHAIIEARMMSVSKKALIWTRWDGPASTKNFTPEERKLAATLYEVYIRYLKTNAPEYFGNFGDEVQAVSEQSETPKVEAEVEVEPIKRKRRSNAEMDSLRAIVKEYKNGLTTKEYARRNGTSEKDAGNHLYEMERRGAVEIVAKMDKGQLVYRSMDYHGALVCVNKVNVKEAVQ